MNLPRLVLVLVGAVSVGGLPDLRHGAREHEAHVLEVVVDDGVGGQAQQLSDGRVRASVPQEQVQEEEAEELYAGDDDESLGARQVEAGEAQVVQPVDGHHLLGHVGVLLQQYQQRQHQLMLAVRACMSFICHLSTTFRREGDDAARVSYTPLLYYGEWMKSSTVTFCCLRSSASLFMTAGSSQMSRST